MERILSNIKKYLKRQMKNKQKAHDEVNRKIQEEYKKEVGGINKKDTERKAKTSWWSFGGGVKDFISSKRDDSKTPKFNSEGFHTHSTEESKKELKKKKATKKEEEE